VQRQRRAERNETRDGFPLQPSVFNDEIRRTYSKHPAQASEPLLVDHRPRALAVSIASLMKKAARSRRRLRECVREVYVHEAYDRAECVREEYVHEEYDHGGLRTA
jgi:hypothetical protein